MTEHQTSSEKGHAERRAERRAAVAGEVARVQEALAAAGPHDGEDHELQLPTKQETHPEGRVLAAGRGTRPRGIVMDEATSMEPTLSGATYSAAVERAEEYLSWEPWQLENLHCGWLSDHSVGTIKGGVLTLTWVGRTKLSVPVPYYLRDLLRELRQGKQLSLF